MGSDPFHQRGFFSWGTMGSDPNVVGPDPIVGRLENRRIIYETKKIRVCEGIDEGSE